MLDLKFRSEDLKNDEIEKFYVETKEDRRIIDLLKTKNPTVIVGGRGVGKTFLLRMAENELINDFAAKRILPVYLSFTKTSLVMSDDTASFHNWMLSKIASKLCRTIRRKGLLERNSRVLDVISGGISSGDEYNVDILVKEFEESYKKPSTKIDSIGYSVDEFKDEIEDICEELSISSISLYIDEAAHVFVPEQQRAFFSLFRDLRSPYITCNAAVYPAVTYYGESFQKEHDATLTNVERDVLSSDYIRNMKEILVKQCDNNSTLLRAISDHSGNFNIIAYAACGNPRIMLKLFAKSNGLRTTDTNKYIKDYFREEIWTEHTALAEKYEKCKALIDWGREFIETTIIPELRKKNTDKSSSSYFWIHRDSPHHVFEALRILSYSGIITLHTRAIKATRSELGHRYILNYGCLLAAEDSPCTTGNDIIKKLSIKIMPEFGRDHPSYSKLASDVYSELTKDDIRDSLSRQLKKKIDVLDLPGWQIEGLKHIGITNICDILDSTEQQIQKIYQVGKARERRIRNAAFAAVYEYISG
jgi:hypothetical protein